MHQIKKGFTLDLKGLEGDILGSEEDTMIKRDTIILQRGTTGLEEDTTPSLEVDTTIRFERVTTIDLGGATMKHQRSPVVVGRERFLLLCLLQRGLLGSSGKFKHHKLYIIQCV